MIVTQEVDLLKSKILDQALADLLTSMKTAAQQGLPAHEVEQSLWEQLLKLGRQLFGQFLAHAGTGDMGEKVSLPDGHTVRRLDKLHRRRLVTIFGIYDLRRTVYGSREGQKIEFVPLDNRLQLPESAFSYILQDWCQGLCVEEAYGKASQTLQRILGQKLSVDTEERMTVHMAQQVQDFRENRPFPAATEEGEVFVLSADGKGVVMRRDQPLSNGHRTKGEKASQKRMALVGTAYTVDRYQRTPEQMVAALFGDREALPRPRPKPQSKHTWASLPGTDEQGNEVAATEIVFPWLLNEVAERNRRFTKEMVFLADGQESLWDAQVRHLPQNCTGIVDLLHVTPRLWQAAHVFHKEKSPEAEKFVRSRLLKILHGQVDRVVRGLHVMATKQKLKGSKKKTITTVCNYYAKNQQRMRYDEYLAKGYPIASGVIEGACRHLVKDRLERAGMHWTIPGAQAMLDMRSTYINDDWQTYQQWYRDTETGRLYPHRQIVSGEKYSMAA